MKWGVWCVRCPSDHGRKRLSILSKAPPSPSRNQREPKITRPHPEVFGLRWTEPQTRVFSHPTCQASLHLLVSVSVLTESGRWLSLPELPRFSGHKKKTLINISLPSLPPHDLNHRATHHFMCNCLAQGGGGGGGFLHSPQEILILRGFCVQKKVRTLFRLSGWCVVWQQRSSLEWEAASMPTSYYHDILFPVWYHVKLSL